MEPKHIFVFFVFSLVMFIAGYFASPTLWPYMQGFTWILFGITAFLTVICGVAVLIE